jgi:hypothetical protein
VKFSAHSRLTAKAFVSGLTGSNRFALLRDVDSAKCSRSAQCRAAVSFHKILIFFSSASMFSHSAKLRRLYSETSPLSELIRLSRS